MSVKRHLFSVKTESVVGDVESLVGSTMEVPQNGDEVMSDPDREVVEAHSSAAVRLVFSTLDEVDLTRIFRLRASVMKTIPSFLRGPFRTAPEAVHPILLCQERGWKMLLLLPRLLLHRPPQGGLVSKRKLVERFEFCSRQMGSFVGGEQEM